MQNTMGCYNNYVNIDTNRLSQLGFSNEEIQNLVYIYNNGGKFTPQALQQYGYNYEQAKRIMYMYNICAGKVVINSQQEIIKHFRKIFGSTYRISMQDLATSNVKSVPRVAVVSNIRHEPFTIWNSKQYKGNDALYRVINATNQRVQITTARKPILKYGQSKEVDGVLKIDGLTSDGNVIVTFNRKFCKLCNRFIIVASLRNPEFHFGKYTMICFEGTKVYVYASSMGTAENVRYSGGTQRVYDWGIFPNDIKPKLDHISKEMYKYVHGVAVTYEAPNSKYSVVEVEKKMNLESNIIE